jgi:LysR family transcriptional regulator for bpeEF and oprC
MDRLMALQAFARVVELGGFTKASDSLQMPKTTVSDLAQSLEKHLGARLLQRTTRRVSVTAEGAAFYERCVHILADLIMRSPPSLAAFKSSALVNAWT